MNHSAYLDSVFGLEGKTILITGAAGGIGAAISKGLADAGAEVALCGRTQSKCQALADEITEKGGKATAHFLDVADMSTIQPCVDEVVERYGKIDVLFNIAGINKREGLLDVTEETYDRIMDTNLKGVYFVSQAVGREMYKRKTGSIVNIGSLNDTIMLGGCSVYGAAKSGVIALTRSMAIELAQYGIRCNAISPGHILTELTQLGPSHPGPLDAGAHRHAPCRQAGGAGGHRHPAGFRRFQLYDGPGLLCGRRLPLRRRSLVLRYEILKEDAAPGHWPGAAFCELVP